MDEDQSHDPLQTSSPRIGDSASQGNYRLPPTLNDDSDPDLPSAMGAILGLVWHSRTLIRGPTWSANEVELRSAVDNLLLYAYDQPGSITFRSIELVHWSQFRDD